MKNIIKNLVSLVCLSLFCLGLALIPVQANPKASQSPIMLGGQFTDHNAVIQPILYLSQDQGHTWAHQITDDQNKPQDFKTNGLILVTDCSTAVCGNGGYYSDHNIRFPLLGVSQNRGEVWDYHIHKNGMLPAGFVDDGMIGWLNCFGDHCAAIGEYMGDQEKIYPLLAATTNAGSDWKLAVDKSNLPPNFFDEGYFNSIDCGANFCAAAGEFINNQLSKTPIIVMSTDRANTWHYAVDGSNSETLPANYQKGGVFRRTQCLDNACAAAGTYINHARKTAIMLATSDENAKWTYKIDSRNHSPAGYFDNGFIYGMHCETPLCTVVGGYTDAQYTQFPMLIVSQDQTKTWQYKMDKTKESLPKDFHNMGALSEAHCSPPVCAVVGYYKDSHNIQYPLLSVSTDNAQTWQFKVQKGLNLPPEFGKWGTLYDIDCRKNRCAATGYYNDPHGAGYPIVIESNDSGNTWEYVVGKGKALPTDFKNSPSFFVVKCDEEACYAGGRYFNSRGSMEPMLVVSTSAGKPWEFIVDTANALPENYITNGYFTNR